MKKPSLVGIEGSKALRVAISRALRLRHQAALASSATSLMLAAGAVQAQSASPAQAATGPEIQEIVVSAQRRTQSLQDVPYNISAVSAEMLHNAGSVSINDLTQLVPGLMNVDTGPADRGGNNNFTLRGLRTDSPGSGVTGGAFQNLTVSPVSTYFGETPVFFQMPVDDIERVEVLRGPQGTLYGSGAQAGTIRFIPTSPKFDRFTAEVSADGSYTQNAPNGNGSVHGILNVPFSNTLALRVVAGEDHLGGFVDAVNRVVLEPNGTPVPSIPGDLSSGFVLGPVQRGTNHSDQWFGRATLRWKPNSALDVELQYLHEHTDMADSQYGSAWQGGPFNTTFGFNPNATVNTRPGCDVCNTEWIAEPFHDTVNLTSLVGTIDVGLGTVTSATSYFDDENQSQFDQTGIYYGIANPPNPNTSNYFPYPPYNEYPRLIGGYVQPSSARTFVQELRLVSNPGKYFDYVAGLYYQHQVNIDDATQMEHGLQAYNESIGKPTPSSLGDVNYYDFHHGVFTDKAIFGELTYHIMDGWQVTAGVRVFRQTFDSVVTEASPLCGAPCSADQTNPNGSATTVSSDTWSKSVKKFNTSYDFTPNLKVYATYAEGFRHGGVSGLPTIGPYASPPNLQSFQPDFAKNYEVGIKGSLFQHRIRYFADVYLINLNDFQFDTVNLSGITGAFNGKKARSEGVELQVEMALTDRLSAGLGYAFTRAYIPEAFDIQDYIAFALIPPGNGQKGSLFGGPIAAGTRLPGVSRNVVTASADYVIPAGFGSSGAWSWKLHADASYRSDQNSNISPTSIYNYVIPSSFVANGRLTLAQDKAADYFLYVRNITNNPQFSGAVNDQEFANPYRLRDIGRPRTFGLGIRYKFGQQ